MSRCQGPHGARGGLLQAELQDGALGCVTKRSAARVQNGVRDSAQVRIYVPSWGFVERPRKDMQGRRGRGSRGSEKDWVRGI